MAQMKNIHTFTYKIEHDYPVHLLQIHCSSIIKLVTLAINLHVL